MDIPKKVYCGNCGGCYTQESIDLNKGRCPNCGWYCVWGIF